MQLGGHGCLAVAAQDPRSFLVVRRDSPGKKAAARFKVGQTVRAISMFPLQPINSAW
jgi:hypothetical protein